MVLEFSQFWAHIVILPFTVGVPFTVLCLSLLICKLRVIMTCVALIKEKRYMLGICHSSLLPLCQGGRLAL